MADPLTSTAPHDEPERPGAPLGSSTFEEDSQSGRRTKRSSFWRELPILVITALVLTFLIQTFLARVYVIPSQSMEQTLHGCEGCSNDRVLVDKVTFDFSDPKPGDVVVFRGPDTWGENDFKAPRSDNPVVSWLQKGAALIGLGPPDERDFVKRVIATAGQTVQCCDAQKHVLVDGKALDEPYVYWEPGTGPADQWDFGPVKVPAGHLWVMGDNRNNSFDSRRQGGGGERGTVPVDNVIGKARVIVLPPGRWRGIGDHNPQVRAQVMGAPAWTAGVPVGAGFAAAWPALWVGRALRDRIVPWRRTTR